MVYKLHLVADCSSHPYITSLEHRIEQEENATITPFEKNLEIWRQLWRVVERSDVVVQIVDARNPLLFRSSDLESYVKYLLN